MFIQLVFSSVVATEWRRVSGDARPAPVGAEAQVRPPPTGRASVLPANRLAARAPTSGRYPRGQDLGYIGT
jgi:hypothetical protein